MAKIKQDFGTITGGGGAEDTVWMDYYFNNAWAAGETSYFVVDVRNYSTLEIKNTQYSDSYRAIEVYEGYTYNDKVLIANNLCTVKDQVYSVDISALNYIIIGRQGANVGKGTMTKGQYRLLV